MTSVRWQAPAPLTAGHRLDDFDSGEPSLDQWLKQRALRNEARGASRTYVVCADGQVVGYYCLATASISAEIAPGALRRNMPDPIPAMVLGRLAVERTWQGHGVGKALMRDAVLRTVQVSEMVGVKALLVQALSDAAVRFYEEHGFRPFPANPRTLFLLLSEVFRES
ncbi:GNAT family N-acetyltransferase [Thiorhodococcus mannitoliphagus]|uniref:GNAT family N-acetyltransferase n=1 Tax=Thiorhodococcus mannitoliphagus TaxID=329406 RepID=A0A6P1E2Z7_9GAMM|nr:GNAT family N-acetyltransferase [Thiorhodococcus mannitoliphagus]NEX23721.1 GNAT family N-acetyltransferase [Thiorhodococcus mannitoliphagus]